MYKDVRSMIRKKGRRRTALLGSRGYEGVVRIFKIVNKEDIVQWDCAFVRLDEWGTDKIEDHFAYLKDDEIFASASYIDGEWLFDKPRTISRLQDLIPDPLTELELLVAKGGDMLKPIQCVFTTGRAKDCHGMGK